MILRTNKNEDKKISFGTTAGIKGEGGRSFGIKKRTTEGHGRNARG